MFTKDLYSLLICRQSETPKRQKRKACGKDLGLYVCRIYLLTLIGIYLQTMRPQRSTEMAMTTQQTQKSDDLIVSDVQRVSYGIKLRPENTQLYPR